MPINPTREEVILEIHRVHNAGWFTAKQLGISPREWDESLGRNLPRLYIEIESLLRQRNEQFPQTR